MLAGCGGGGAAPFNPAPAQHAAERRHPSVTETVLYSFADGSDGAYPEAGLINVNGTLYGTTSSGGANDGTVFSITPSGAETVLHSFAGGSDGAEPTASLTNVNHTLYGTTHEGGGGHCGLTGCGTVFSITRSGAETVLHSFGGVAGGEFPSASLIKVKGVLYGTTASGGSGACGSVGCGTVFAIPRFGSETLLYSFAGGSDGAGPDAGLINVKGTLYGTTSAGGASNLGAVFSLTPSGTEAVLHSFDGSDGANPYAGLIKVNNVLYGTTAFGGANCGSSPGCGTVFAIGSFGVETVLHSFAGGSDGANPRAGLIYVNGTLYGTTSAGGASNLGTVFSITPSGTETVLYSFAGGSDGANPYAGLINVNGTFYGTTEFGGVNNVGTVFSLTP